MPDIWESYRDSWRRSLRAEAKSPRTIDTYTLAVDQFGIFLAEGDHPHDPRLVERAHIELFLGHVLDTRSTATAKQRYQSLRSFFSWVEDEERIESPMLRMKPPKVEEHPPDILTEQELAAVLAVASGRGFEDRRDAALIALLADTGARASEITGLSIGDVNLDLEVINVRGKGGRFRSAPFGHETAVRLDRYLRVRSSHPYAGRTDFLWLGKRGELSRSGLAQMVKRRGREAGVENMYAHRFRHTFVHRWLAAGGQEGDVARILGWTRKSAASMLDRYGASAATERAHAAHSTFGVVDHL